MNWDAIGAIGESVGALSVLITLIYLATQVRMSNRLEAANHIDVHMDRVRQNMFAFAQNEDMARIWRIGSEGGELDEDEIVRWEAMAGHRILIQRDAWLRGRILGNMPGLGNPTHYLDILVGGLDQNPRFRHFYETSSLRGLGWGDEFLDYVDGRLAEKTSGDKAQ